MIPLINAKQSSNYPKDARRTADKAVDLDLGLGDDSQPSCTGRSRPMWWTAELPEATIMTIELYISRHSSKQLGKLKLETRLSDKDAWKTCVDDHTVTKPIRPHVIRCNDVTVAKELKISMTGGKEMCFREVRVLGTRSSSNGKQFCHLKTL